MRLDMASIFSVEYHESRVLETIIKDGSYNIGAGNVGVRAISGEKPDFTRIAGIDKCAWQPALVHGEVY